MLKIPKSTISPILKTLCELNFLKQNRQNSKYTIGLNSFIIGNKFLDDIDIIDIIKEHMNTIVKNSNEICQLGILEGDEVVYIAKVDPTQPIKLSSSVGKTLPANCTALGKILLSSLSNESIINMYKNGLAKITEKSIDDINVLLSQIEEIRISNFAFESGESNPQIECLAVPIFNRHKIIASMSVSIPMFRSSKKLIQTIKQDLLAQSQILSKKIGNLDIDIT